MEQIEKNKSVFKLLKEFGDNLETVKEVNHWIFFKSFDDMCDYKDIVVKKGFKVSNMSNEEDADETHPFTLIINREDKVDIDSINGVTIELCELAEEFDANYDGWEIPLFDE
jgi:regulator of RNase E activity RraB